MKKTILKWSAALIMTAALITGVIQYSGAYPATSCFDPYGGKRNTIPDTEYCAVFYTCDDWYQPVQHECPWEPSSTRHWRYATGRNGPKLIPGASKPTIVANYFTNQNVNMKKRILKWSAAMSVTAALVFGIHKQSEAYPTRSCASLVGQYWIYIPDDTYCAVFWSCTYDWEYVRHECYWPQYFDFQTQVCEWPDPEDEPLPCF